MMDKNRKPKTIPIAEEKKPYVAIVEALIFSSDTPITTQRIREILTNLSGKDIQSFVAYLNARYEDEGRSFRIREIAGGYQMFTLPEFSAYVEKLYESKQRNRLSAKALETLAIIAYKQPITRHEIEEIRGVNVDGVVRTLLARNLITIAGRAEAPGSPFLYKTTKKFLEYFGLKSLSDLPRLKEIDELIEVEDRSSPFHEQIIKEISPSVLGIKVTVNGDNGITKIVGNGKEKKNNST